jgi:glycosyltransferase involved in cell wall biosynthesis
MMRVAHLLTSLNPGGVATFVRHLLPALAERGVESEIILTLNRGAVADVLEHQGIALHTCWLHGQRQVPWSYRAGRLLRRSAAITFPWRLARLLRQIRPDVVHSHMHGMHWSSQAAAAHLAGAPLLLTLYSPTSQYHHTWPAKHIFRRLVRPGDRINGVGPTVYHPYHAFFQTLPPWLIHAPDQGILTALPDPGPRNLEKGQMLRSQAGIPGNALVVGSIGRLVPEKRYRDLLDAMTMIPSPTVHLLLVGDGSERSNLEEHARRLGLTARVHFAGFQTNPQDWLNAIDIYVLPSLSEGLSVAIIEAMAGGLAIVATNVAGIYDILTPNENGLLVPPQSSEALALAIRQLAEKPEQRARLGTQARRSFLEKLTLDRAADAYLLLYREMVKDFRGNQ